MSVSNSSAKGDVSSDGAVEGSLVSRVTSRWPSIGLDSKSIFVLENSVLLLDSILRLLFCDIISIEHKFSVGSEVGVDWHKLFVSSVLPGVAFAENEDVVTSAEGVGVVGDGLKDDL